jgi:hypothetical protein
MRVYRGELFVLQTSQVLNAPYEKKIWPSVDILAYVSQRIHPQDLGFTTHNPPDRKYILNLAYTLDQNLEIFTGGDAIDDEVAVPVEFLERNKFFDPFLKPSKRPLFLKSTETKNREISEKLKRRIIKKQRRSEYLHIQAAKVGREISDLNANIDQMQ